MKAAIVAKLLNIPHKAAVQVIHESLAVFLQARRAAGGLTHKLT